MSIKIYHNPRCSKSRETLSLLESKGYSLEVIKYLENPPSQLALKKILKMLEVSPVEIIRFKEKAAKELGIHPKDQRTDAEWVGLIVNHPTLLERPIVVVDNEKAAIGRPPENVLVICD